MSKEPEIIDVEFEVVSEGRTPSVAYRYKPMGFLEFAYRDFIDTPWTWRRGMFVAWLVLTVVGGLSRLR